MWAVWPIGWMITAVVSVCPSGFKLKHFLRDNETLSSFLRRNASFPEDAIQQITEADINLRKVRSLSVTAHCGHSGMIETRILKKHLDFSLLPATSGPPQRIWSPPA